MKRLILMVLLTLGLSSCFQNTLVDPRRSNSKLTVKVFEKGNTPSINAKINIYNINTRIFNDSTNMNGEFSCQLLEGEYNIKVKQQSGLITFTSSESIQMIGGFDRVREYKPYENIGNLRFQIKNKDGLSLSGINVSLLARLPKIINYSTKFNDYFQYNFQNTTTDSNGQVTFTDVPIEYSFRLFLYRSVSNYYLYPQDFGMLYNNDDYFIQITCPI